jgi:hypothetical protein
VIPQPDGTNIIFKHRMISVVLGSGNPQTHALSSMQQGWAAYDQWLNMGRPITDASQLLNHLKD